MEQYFKYHDIDDIIKDGIKTFNEINTGYSVTEEEVREGRWKHSVHNVTKRYT